MSLKLLTLLALAALAYGQQRAIEPPLRFVLEPPPGDYVTSPTRNVNTLWIPMRIDHFDNSNTATYNMRYMVNDEFFGGTGSPVFIMVGGEWTISPGWLQTGNMYEMARENRGYMIYTEHRYYGQSLPYSSFTTENLRFLNVEQALADLAEFIRQLQTQAQFAQSKIILVGGSYAANMAIWFKQRYPDLAYGVIASSGPILAEVDFTGYLEVVHDAFLAEGGSHCIDQLRLGIEQTVAAMATESSRRSLEAAFRLCGPLDYDNVYDIGYFSGLITWGLSGLTQSARPGTIANACAALTSNTYGVNPMSRLGGFISTYYNGVPTTGCLHITYENFINSYMQNTESRAWYYQTCTEYGFYQTAPRSGTVFDPLTWMSEDFYINICQRIFDPSFNAAYVHAAVARTNSLFGGLNPVVENTINIHGTVDPWHALGVYDRDIGETSPTITIPRASHCFDLQPWLTTDTIRMTNVKQDTRRIVARWLNATST